MSLNSENDQTPNRHDTTVVLYIKLNYFMGIGQYSIHQFQAIFTHKWYYIILSDVMKIMKFSEIAEISLIAGYFIAS